MYRKVEVCIYDFLICIKYDKIYTNKKPLTERVPEVSEIL